MHDEPRQQLCRLIAQYGRSLADDPRRCGALLRDHCGQYKREIFVLVNALENRVAVDLLMVSAGVPLTLLLAGLRKRLEDDLGFADEVARWAVETWALALGVIDQPAPKIDITQIPQQSTPLPTQSKTIDSKFISFTPPSGGRLYFPKFNVGKIIIDSKKMDAIGEICIPSGQTVELIVADDITDFSFLESVDPRGIVRRLSLAGNQHLKQGSLLYIGCLRDIEYLNLSRCTPLGRLTPEDNAIISRFYRLLELDLDHTHGGQYALSYISQSLESLVLYMPSFADFIDVSGVSCFNHITKLSNLKKLSLRESSIDDNSLRYLGKLTKLKELDLTKCTKITGTGILTHLGYMTHLQSLNLTGCDNINPSRLQEFKSMLPNTRILP